MVKKFSVITVLVLAMNLVAQSFIWPTNASHLLTSSFGEYRPRRFHAGIDIKTWGQEGYPVFAMEDGYIWRVRISPQGYGKVLYIRHRDDFVTVYAHLQGFYPPLEEFIRQEQLKTASWVQEFYFPPSRFPVKKGELIAYTGSTGIGFPHLHVEIRRPAGVSLNPLIFLKDQVKDFIPPRPMELAIVPEAASTTIDGKFGFLILPCQQKEKSHYTLQHTPVISGPFSLSIRIFDFMEGGFNRFHPHLIELWMDGHLVTKISLDTLDYNYNHHSILFWDYLLERAGYSRFIRLKKEDSFKLHFFQHDGWNAFIQSLENGLHHVSLRFMDYHGNQSDLEFSFMFNPPPVRITMQKLPDSLSFFIHSPLPVAEYAVKNYFKHSPLFSEDGPSGKFASTGKTDFRVAFSREELTGLLASEFRLKTTDQLQLREFFLYDLPDEVLRTPLFLSDETDLPGQFVFTVHGLEIVPDLYPDELAKPFVGISRQGINQIQVSVKKEFFLRDSVVNLYNVMGYEAFSIKKKLYFIPAGQEAVLFAPDRSWKIEIPSQALFDSAYFQLETLPGNSIASPPAYPIRSAIFSQKPHFLRSSSPFRVYLPASPAMVRNHIFPAYFDQSRGQWMFLPSAISQDSLWFECPVYSAEYFSLIQDTVPPTILPLNRSTNFSRSQEIAYMVDDEFSGIDSIDQIEVFRGGNRQLFEWDPEEKRITIPGWSLNEGEWEISVRVTDNAGNVSVFNHSVQITR